MWARRDPLAHSRVPPGSSPHTSSQRKWLLAGASEAVLSTCSLEGTVTPGS